MVLINIKLSVNLHLLYVQNNAIKMPDTYDFIKIELLNIFPRGHLYFYFRTLYMIKIIILLYIKL